MVIEELEANKDVWRSELRDCLVDYYVNILSLDLRMDGAGGMPWSSTFKRNFKSISANATTDCEGAAAAAIEANPEHDSDPTNSPAPPPAVAAASAAPAEDAPAAEAAAEAASPPGKGGRGLRRGTKGAKAT